MKTKILTVFAVLMLLLQLSVNAANYKYSITVGDNFISAESGDDLAEISEKLNMNVDELKTYFNKNGLLYIAVSETDKIQIMLSAYTDNYSSEVMLKTGGLTVNLDEHTVTVDGKRVPLTYKEFELLRLFLSHPGMAFTRDQLFNE